MEYLPPEWKKFNKFKNLREGELIIGLAGNYSSLSIIESLYWEPNLSYDSLYEKVDSLFKASNLYLKEQSKPLVDKEMFRKKLRILIEDGLVLTREKVPGCEINYSLTELGTSRYEDIWKYRDAQMDLLRRKF